MCDPVTIAGILKVGGDIIQGNINKDTASKQQNAETQGLNAARSSFMQGSQNAQQTLSPFANMGQQAGQAMFDLGMGNTNLQADPMLQREMMLANQAGSARGMSLAPSFQAETMGALIPGVAQRRQALLSPIFSTGYNASQGISTLQAQQGAGLANFDLTQGQINSRGIGAQAPNISGLMGDIASIYNPAPEASTLTQPYQVNPQNTGYNGHSQFDLIRQGR